MSTVPKFLQSIIKNAPEDTKACLLRICRVNDTIEKILVASYQCFSNKKHLIYIIKTLGDLIIFYDQRLLEILVAAKELELIRLILVAPHDLSKYNSRLLMLIVPNGERDYELLSLLIRHRAVIGDAFMELTSTIQFPLSTLFVIFTECNAQYTAKYHLHLVSLLFGNVYTISEKHELLTYILDRKHNVPMFDINYRDGYIITRLIKYKYTKTVALFIQHGARLDYPAIGTLLFQTSTLVEIVEMIFGAGAHLTRDIWNRAWREEAHDTILRMLYFGFQPALVDRDLLLKAVESGRYALVYALLEGLNFTTEQIHKAINLASTYCNYDIIKLLITYAKSPLNCEEGLNHAIQLGRLDIARLLIEYGVRPHHIPYMEVVVHNDVEFLDGILSIGVAKQIGLALMHESILRHNMDYINTLLKYKIGEGDADVVAWFRSNGFDAIADKLAVKVAPVVNRGFWSKIKSVFSFKN